MSMDGMAKFASTRGGFNGAALTGTRRTSVDAPALRFQSDVAELPSIRQVRWHLPKCPSGSLQDIGIRLWSGLPGRDLSDSLSFWKI